MTSVTTSNTILSAQLEDGLQHPSVDVHAFATTYSNKGVTLTFDLRNIIR